MTAAADVAAVAPAAQSAAARARLACTDPFAQSGLTVAAQILTAIGGGAPTSGVSSAQYTQAAADIAQAKRTALAAGDVNLAVQLETCRQHLLNLAIGA
jgi:hypothetical protein